MPVGELSQSFKVSGATLSFHLRVLRQAGLIQPQRRGRTLVYNANRMGLRPIDLWLGSHRLMA